MTFFEMLKMSLKNQTMQIFNKRLCGHASLSGLDDVI